MEWAADGRAAGVLEYWSNGVGSGGQRRVATDGGDGASARWSDGVLE
jgi:hypothetical protein